MANNDKVIDYFPIGTVVLLKGGSKKVMIIGYKPEIKSVLNNESKSNVWDYSGCIFPEGLLSSEQVLMFNHEQIETIYNLGYKNEEQERFKEQLQIIDKKRNSNS